MNSLRRNSLRPSTLLTRGALTLIFSVNVIAGPDAKPASVRPKTAEPELLSFFSGALIFDLEERLRFEARSDNRDFDDQINDDTDDSWLVNRFRLGVTLKPASWLKLYGQMQDTREWNSDRPNTPGIRGTEGEDNFDLRQAFVEFSNYKEFPIGLVIGRQVLNYGDSRLVADGKWANFGRTFDAVKLRYQADKFWIDAFASRPVQIKEEVINDSDAADNFYGVYASTEALTFQTTDLYFLYRDKEDNQPDLDPANPNDPRGTWTGPAQRIGTLGTRWKSGKALRGWDYTVEAAVQFGDLWTGDRSTLRLEQRAFAGHLSGGYTFEDTIWKPRLGVAYNYASGDSDPTDNESQSFQNLFPSNHAKFGDMDEFGWRNLHHFRAQLQVRPVKSIEVELAYNADWLADTSDYWYRSNGVGTARTRTPDGRDVRTIGASNFAGQELDVIVRWKATSWFNLETGYAHFFAGAYLSETGPADDADFGYVQAQLLF